MWTLLRLGCLMAVFVFFGALILPRGYRPRAQGQLTACKSNCKNLATALEMYAADNQKLYPDRLESLPPNYLRQLPTCPAAGAFTYTDYRVSSNRQYFRFSCCGRHHAKAYQGFEKDCLDYPRYNSKQGLIDHP